jgi:hypothetical protein
MNIGYLTVPYAGGQSSVDWEWLATRPRADESEHCVWTRLEEPLDILMDGRVSRSVIRKTKPSLPTPVPEACLDAIE